MGRDQSKTPRHPNASKPRPAACAPPSVLAKPHVENPRPRPRKGCIRNVEHAYSQDGGLASCSATSRTRLRGENRRRGRDILKFTGRARVFESQAAVEGILGNKSLPATSSSSATKARKAGMQEMLYPTSYLKSKGLGKACALLTDGRFSAVHQASPSATLRLKRRRRNRFWYTKATPSKSTFKPQHPPCHFR